MSQYEVLVGVLLDKSALSLEELAHACAVDVAWVVQHIETGLAKPDLLHRGDRCFSSDSMTRMRRLAATEQHFDANPELAALVVDLIEEVAQLKQALAGRHWADGRM